jgi:O-antigen/teichoic acid export membrane protein
VNEHGPPAATNDRAGSRQDVGLGDRESRPTIARNALYLVVGQASTTALAIVLSAALGRYLGAGDFGVYYLVTTMSTFAYVFVEWGQPLFVIRELAREPSRSGDLLGTALALRTAFAIAVAIPAGILEWALGYGARTSSLSVALILATLPFSLSQGYGMVFRARDRMGRDVAVSVSNKAIALGLTLVGLALGKGIPGVILAQALAGVAAVAIAHKLYVSLSGAPPLRTSSLTARHILAAGTPILAMTAASYVQPYLDAIILSKLTPSTVVGWLGAARNILGTLMAPATILGAAAYPRIARASHDLDTLRREVRSAFRPLLFLAALAGIGTYHFAGAVIDLIYGAGAFGPAATILMVFSPGLFLLFIDIFSGNVIYASGRGTGFATAKVLSVLVGTALDFLLIPYCQREYGNGGIGVVVSFGLSEFVVFAGALVILLRRHALEAATALDAARALGAAAVTVLLLHLVPPLPLTLGIPLCVGAFVGVSLLFRLLALRDLILLWNIVRREDLDRAGAAGPNP